MAANLLKHSQNVVDSYLLLAIPFIVVFSSI